VINETVRKLVPVSTVATQPTSTPLCGCTHHNWLTCIAEQEHMSRFNASIVFATTTKELNGRCQCLCHQDAQGQQVSEQGWQRIVAQDNRKSTKGMAR
jgi:hypothetical protein